MESVALTYAKALFSLSIEEKTSDILLDEIKAIYAATDKNRDLVKLLESKNLNKNDKKEIISNIFKGKINNSLLNFLKLLVDKSRIHHLNKICIEYRKEYLKYNKIKEAKIYSVNKLDDKKLDEIKEVLKTKYNSEFIVENFIDEKLIAGIKIVIGDLVIDGSVDNKIKRMKSSIAI